MKIGMEKIFKEMAVYSDDTKIKFYWWRSNSVRITYRMAQFGSVLLGCVVIN